MSKYSEQPYQRDQDDEWRDRHEGEPIISEWNLGNLSPHNILDVGPGRIFVEKHLFQFPMNQVVHAAVPFQVISQEAHLHLIDMRVCRLVARSFVIGLIYPAIELGPGNEVVLFLSQTTKLFSYLFDSAPSCCS